MIKNFKNIGKKYLQPRILYPEKLFFRSEGEIKTSANKKKNLKEFITTRPTLQDKLKKVL